MTIIRPTSNWFVCHKAPQQAPENALFFVLVHGLDVVVHGDAGGASYDNPVLGTMDASAISAGYRALR
jgi:hypothetical protein